MMTDRQLKALMVYVKSVGLAAVNGRSFAEISLHELYEAFGFVKGPDGWPVVPQYRYKPGATDNHPASAEPLTTVTLDGNPLKHPDGWPVKASDLRSGAAYVIKDGVLSFAPQHTNTGLAASDQPEDGPVYHPLREPAWDQTQKRGTNSASTPLATSDPEGHRQAIADAAAEDRISGLWALFNERWSGVPQTHRELAESLVCLWPELKAIMEPPTDWCRGCGCKRGEKHTSNYPSAEATCRTVQREWDGDA